jgi:hypothetical protein
MNQRDRLIKRFKLDYTHHDDKRYIPICSTTPKGGYPTEGDNKGFCFYDPSETEYFNPKKDPVDELERYKTGLIVDKVHNVKRLAEPKRWCVLPETETVTVEVPLTYHDWQYEKEVVQELGHVAWYKAYYHLDKEVYQEAEVEISVKQVLQKVERNQLPRWRPRNRYWDVEIIGYAEVPGTIFCTERELLKKKKYWSGPEIQVLHYSDVARTRRDNIGCSIFRRHQPPSWARFSPRTDEVNQQNNEIWAGLEFRNQWIYKSLYTIWAGEHTQSANGYDWTERVLWTGPARIYNSEEYLKCNHPPHCVVIPDNEESE